MDRSDIDHDACSRLFNSAEEQVLIPSPVVVEVDWLASQRLHPDAFGSFLVDILDGRLEVVDLVSEDYRRVSQLLAQYSELCLGFVDAAVFAVVERVGEAKLATLDRRHFSVLRPRHVPALRLLP